MNRRAAVAIVVLGFLWIVNQAVIGFEEDPVGAVRAELSSFGHDPEAFHLKSYDSHYGPIGRTLEVTFVDATPQHTTIVVKAVRRLAFGGWQVRSVGLVTGIETSTD